MIPASATNIDIQELAPSSNFLGLSIISIPLDSYFALHLELRPIEICSKAENFPQFLVLIFSNMALFFFSFIFSALSDSSRSYFFNGDYVITSPKKFHIAGTVFNYERTGFGKERISSLGPTSIPVHVEVLAVFVSDLK